MEKNSFNIIEHLGNTVYKAPKANNSFNYLNSFCLLNKTITSVFTPMEGNSKIILECFKLYENINNQKVKFKYDNSSTPYYLEKQYFFENTQFNNILSAKTKFEDIHKDEVENFKLLKNEDKSISSLYYHIQIINNLKSSGQLKAKETKMKSRLENLKDYEIENYSLISSSFECIGAPPECKYYRRIKANGNSFYISFMYQYIKNLIIKKEEKIISEMFYIMDKELNPKNKEIKNENFELGNMYLSKNLNDDLTPLFQTFAFFSLLYNSMTDDNIEEAIKILNYATTYEESFANYICLFMRIQIKNFININKHIFNYEKYCQQYNLIEERYYKNKEFLCEEYIFNNIFINQMEPSKLIISLIPYIFNVSMNLFINEKNYHFEKISFDLKDYYEADITISILYSSFSYHIIEENGDNINPKITLDNSNTLILENNYKNFDREKYSKIITGKENCNKCNKSEFIKFKNISEFEVCLNCLKKTIDEVLIDRYNRMLNERFRYLEFYLRDIPILSDSESSNYIFLSPPEFYCIFQNNIFIYFRNLMKNICDHCGKLKINLIMKPCGCKNCIQDIESKVKEIPMTDFEKNFIYKNKKIKCECGKENNYVELALKLYNKYSDSKQNSISKNNVNSKYLSKYCMSCGVDLKTDCIGKERKEFTSIKFKTGNEHKICKDCSPKQSSGESSEIFCVICGKNHENSDFNKSIKDVKKNPNGEGKIPDKETKESISKKNVKKTSQRKKNSDTACCIIY